MSWKPSFETIQQANITQFMTEVGINDIHAFHRWTTDNYPLFWQKIIDKLGILFKHPPSQLVDLTKGLETPHWLPGAKINIIDSCFKAPATKIALISPDGQMTYKELDQLSNQIANSLIELGLKSGDAVGQIMPMTNQAIAIYFGIIKMGGIVVSIADSFSSDEIKSRLDIAAVKLVFTQENITWGGKLIPLYEKICRAASVPIILTSINTQVSLRIGDYRWHNFLKSNNQFTSVAGDPNRTCQILFSSGTTAAPKAIPWNHTTPIKVASDAYFHQDIKNNDILAWPTNLGWMMGPWLVFAALLHQATLALYPDTPNTREFGQFVEKNKVTMLGVVPTLVATWRQSKCMENLDWNAIKLFSSSGECSNANDMTYLMSLAKHKPIIEYCGGTEIGGAYISSTVIQENFPSLFSTPAMGSNFTILDEQGRPAEIGEVALIPPAIGLSTTVLNADHHHIYYENMPTTLNGAPLRRHGDQIKRLPNGYYSLLGRVDDTMNLSGIKVSAADIERVLTGIPEIIEVAAVSHTPPTQGPAQLIIFAASVSTPDKHTTLITMQERINKNLNPLFKIHDIVFVKELPKTASNKIMRRLLREMHC